MGDDQLDSTNRPTETSEVVSFWLSEIDACKEREREYRKRGQEIIETYEGGTTDPQQDTADGSKIPFNILFSNTETLIPALYSKVPRPVVERRYKDADPLGKASSDAGKRTLEFLIDTNLEGYETFDEAMINGLLDALLPGRGWTSVKYDEGPGGEAQQYKGELVCTETKVWNRVFIGYAKKWSKVPWIAYEEYLTKEECTKRFGKEKANQLNYFEGNQRESQDDEPKNEDEAKHQGSAKTATIYQIWDKDGGRKIRYISPQYKKGYLLEQDDPLGLTGFFNCPRPINMVYKAHNLTPTAPYALYQNQAKELNRIQRRINHVVEAIKARGLYDGELASDLDRLFKVDEAGLVPTEKGSSLAAEKGLSNAIWYPPLDVFIKVLQELYKARESCKQVIYEITGISDIIRGQTKASETLGAQQIKREFGSLRLKRMQREVQRYARDLLRMMLELAATKFSEETWARMTGLPYTTTQEREQLERVQFIAQQQGQPLSPQDQERLKQPSWRDVLKLLKDDLRRSYRIDIETNSTIEPEAAEDQKQITELLQALGQYLAGVSPLVQSKVLPFQAAQAMMMTIVRRYRFGSEIEDFIAQMREPQQEDDSKENQREMAKITADMEMKKLALQQDANLQAMKLQAEQKAEALKLQLEQNKMQHEKDIESAKQSAETFRETLRLEEERRAKQSELDRERSIEEMKARINQETELKKMAMQIEGQKEVARIQSEARKNTEPVNA